MNHRYLLTVVSSWFGPRETAANTQTTPTDWTPRDILAGRAFTGGSAPDAPIRELTVIVRRSGSAIAAERSRLALLAQAGEVQKGMGIHATHVIGQSLPPHLTLLPGSLVTWDTVAGAAAFRKTWVAGYFRRGDLVWEIIVSGGEARCLAGLVIDLATDLESREMSRPDPIDPEWTGGLWSLLPDEGDLPGPMLLDTVFAGDRIYDMRAAPLAA